MLVSMGAFGFGSGSAASGSVWDRIGNQIQQIQAGGSGGAGATRTPIPVPAGPPAPAPIPSQMLPPGNTPAASIPAGPGPMLPPTSSPASAAPPPAGVTVFGQQVGIPTLLAAGGAAALGLYLLLRRRG